MTHIPTPSRFSTLSVLVRPHNQHPHRPHRLGRLMPLPSCHARRARAENRRAPRRRRPGGRSHRDEPTPLRRGHPCSGFFEYATVAEREAESAGISPQGQVTVTRNDEATLTVAQWSPPPRVFAHGRLIVLTFGPSDTTLAALTELLGGTITPDAPGRLRHGTCEDAQPMTHEPPVNRHPLKN